MKIYTIADKTEEKFLRTKTADFDFSEYTKKDIDGLIKKMKSAMLKAKGIGLSGNQIGLNLNFFIAQIPKIQGQKIIGRESYTVFNPQITKISKQTIATEEGCLSVPGIYGLVERSVSVVLRGEDRYSKKITIKANDLLARVFQHETDHLNGILFIDKAKKLYKTNETQNNNL